MAEPDSILQLGIEAARDGNKEEARNLFRLLTRQEPKNAQAWLWLAGVAENREERQAALERVVELDPTNEMAIKGLQALGVQPGSRTTPPPPVEAVPSAPAPAASSPYDDDDPFAELDALSGVMADAEGPVRRNDPPPTAVDPVDGGVAADTASTSRSSTSPRIFSSGRSTSSSRSVYDEDDEEEVAPPRRGVPLLNILLGLVALFLIGLLIVFLFFRPGGENVAGQPGDQETAVASGTAPAVTAGTGLTPTTEGGSVGTSPTEAVTGTATLEQPTVAPTPEVLPTAAPSDVSTANPVIVGSNNPLQSDGWLYDFNQPTYAAPIIGPLGQYQPNNGRFVVVLIFAVNNTGSSQNIPANFFVLKDAQGRVWEARPEVSEAYVIPGVNADLSHAQPLPTDGLTRSVALIFDVAPDATNLVFFARSNPTQGWLVLPNV